MKIIIAFSLLFTLSFCTKVKNEGSVVKPVALADQPVDDSIANSKPVQVATSMPKNRVLARPVSKKIDEKALVLFLQQHLVYYDANPIHQEEADKANAFIKKVLARKYSKVEREKLRIEALGLFYDSSVGMFEDSPDVRRFIARRYFSFLSLALLSDEWRYPRFLSDADNEMEALDFEEEKAQNMLLTNMVELLILERDDENHSEGMQERSVDDFLNRLESELEVIDNEEFVKGCLSVFK